MCMCVCVCECIGVNRWQKRSFMVLRHIRTQWVVCECIWLTPDCAIEMLWCQCNNKNNRISDKCTDSSIQCVCAYVFLSLLTASPVCVCQQQQEKCECQAKEYAFYEARKCKICKNAKSRVAINVQLHCGTRICLHIHTHTCVSMLAWSWVNTHAHGYQLQIATTAVETAVEMEMQGMLATVLFCSSFYFIFLFEICSHCNEWRGLCVLPVRDFNLFLCTFG